MNKKEHWTIINIETKYKSPWLEVTEEKVIHPDGKEGLFSIVKKRNSIAVLPLDKEGNVHLVRQFRYGFDKECLEACAGIIDEGEEPIKTAKRELQEELGIYAKKWTSLGIMKPQATVRQTTHLFLAEELTYGDTNHEGSEIIRTEKMTFAKTIEKVMKSEITHWASVGVILKADNYLRTSKKKY